MRDIKFRAWDGQKYITFDNHKYDLVYNDISGWNVKPNLPNYKGMWTTGESSSSGKSFKLEQYTGLKDKNGVEIFEGDVVTRMETENVEEFSGVVMFIDKGFTTNDYSNDLFLECVLDYQSEVIEVIGNIHENPELLEQD